MGEREECVCLGCIHDDVDDDVLSCRVLVGQSSNSVEQCCYLLMRVHCGVTMQSHVFMYICSLKANLQTEKERKSKQITNCLCSIIRSIVRNCIC